MATALTPEIKAKLYAETDARFAAQTGVTRKLDPKNPIDAKLVPVWLDAYKKVLTEWKAGKIVWSHQNPDVAGALSAATQHAFDAAAHLGAAMGAIAAGLSPTSQDVQKPLADAHESHVASQQASAAAAEHQPPTVSPEHVAKASHEVMHFTMDAGGHGVRTDPSDAVTTMQVTSAPATAAAQTASTQEQADASATHDGAGHSHKKLAEEIGIAAALAAALGLVVFAVKGKGSMRGRPHASHTFRAHRRRRAA